MRGLLELSLETLAQSTGVVQHLTQDGVLPPHVHCLLFSATSNLVPKLGTAVRSSIMTLVSFWPREVLRVRDLLPEENIKSLLSTSTKEGSSLLFMIMEGLLSLQPSSKLRTVDFQGICAPCLFQLPLLSLHPEERSSGNILREIRKQCESYSCEDLDNLESVLSWKLTEMSEKKEVYSFNGPEYLTVLTELSLNLAEWLGMDDEILGMVVQRRTPFRMNISKLCIHNFHLRETERLRWILSLINPQDLQNLELTGYRRSLSFIMFHIKCHFQQLTSLSSFTMATAGPGIMTSFDDDPTPEDRLSSTIEVFSHWSNLNDLAFNRVQYRDQIGRILGALSNPLNKLFLYANNLSANDVAHLAMSHHIPSLKELTLEQSSLRGSAEHVCELVKRAQNLKMLNLRDTNLKLHEQIDIVTALTVSSTLDTLMMHDSEDMLSTSGYESLVELACLIKPLKQFYVFPFSYKPFEMFYRHDVLESCQLILASCDKRDLQLFY